MSKKISDKVFDLKMAEYATKKAEYDDKCLVLDIDKKRDSTLYSTHKHKGEEDRTQTQHSVQEFWLEAKPDEPIKPHRRPNPGDTVSVHVVPEDIDMGATVAPTSAIAGTTIQIEAVPRLGYRFVEWSDGNTDQVRDIYVVDDIDLVGYFERIPSPAFYIAPVGSTAVVINPVGLKMPDYSYDGFEWISYAGTPIVAGNGEKVYWRSDGRISNDCVGFELTGGRAMAGGNVMSLTKKIDYEAVSQLKDYALARLFEGAETLENVINMKIPATSVGKKSCYRMFAESSVYSVPTAGFLDEVLLTDDYCYQEMFKDCEALTTIPNTILPAEILATGCYQSMFEGCFNLAVIPTGLFHSVRMAESCYEAMFRGCTRISHTADQSNILFAADRAFAHMYEGSSVSELVGCIPVVGVSMCEGMFYNCPNIVTIPDGYLPDTTLADYCYKDMFYMCPSLVNVPVDLLHTDLVPLYAYQNMFRECESLITPPELNAVACRTGSFQSMFQGCVSLETIPQIDIVSVPNNAMESMFEGCSSITIADIHVPRSLGERSLARMFAECSELTSATMGFLSVGDTSCQEMFINDVSLDYIHADFIMPLYFDKHAFTKWVSGVKNFGLPEGGYFYEADGSHWLEGSANGNPWKHGQDYFLPLHFYADHEFTISLEITEGNVDVIEYTTDLYSWKTYTPGLEIHVPLFKRLYFRRNLIIPSSETKYVTFHSDVPVGMRGNLSSMVVKENFWEKTDNAMPFSHYKMFYGFEFEGTEHLVSSATTLSESCYRKMFSKSNIRDLGEVLKEDAVLAQYCYANMFQECTGLSSDMSYLVLGSEVVPQGAYSEMFAQTGIQVTPTMNFKTIDGNRNCYQMFADCGNLNKIIIPEYDYDQVDVLMYHSDIFTSWARGVTEEGEFICNPNSAWVDGESANPWMVIPDEKYLWVRNTSTNREQMYLASGYGYILYSWDAVHWKPYREEGLPMLPGELVMFKSESRSIFSQFWLECATGRSKSGARNAIFKVGGKISALFLGEQYETETYTLRRNYVCKFGSRSCVWSLEELDIFSNMIYQLDSAQSTRGTFREMCRENYALKIGPRHLYGNATILSDMFNNAFTSCLYMTSIGEDCFEGTKTVDDNGCYMMFAGCRSLKRTPRLAAETLGSNAYREMFNYCDALESVAPIDAKYVKKGSSQNFMRMFINCTALVDARFTLDVKELLSYQGCYEMFRGCTSLKYAPTFMTEKFGERTFYSCFMGCRSLMYCQDTFYFTDIRDAKFGLYQMYSHCSSLQKAPKLPIKMWNARVGKEDIGELTAMFEYCTNLNEIWISLDGFKMEGLGDSFMFLWLLGNEITNGVVHVSSGASLYKGILGSGSTSGLPKGWSQRYDYNP